MDQPPSSPPGPEPTPDVPKPPIWEERLAANAATGEHPTIPDITIPGNALRPSSSPATRPAPNVPLPTVAPSLGTDGPQLRRGPAFERAAERSVAAGATTSRATTSSRGAIPASGETGAHTKPQWPAVPPTAATQTSPAPPIPPAPRRRLGLVLLALAALAGLVAGSFIIGRNFAGETTATVPVAAPTAPTAVAEPPAPEPTDPPEPTVVPTPAPTPTADEAPQNDATLDTPAPVVPDDAEEPVAAVAAAVAPAVVLIQHEAGQGSGIIYDAEGLILTNAHVVGQFTEVSVQLASGIRVAGTVVGADANTDVAVVRIDTDAEFGVAPLAPESSVEVGQLAVAIGSPFGLEQTVTSGIVSAKGRVVGTVAMIQTDAPINPGNSGGALADRQGRVIGMNTAIRTDGSGGNVGVGFAIPSDTAKLVADRILAGDSLEQGYLGVEGATPTVGDPGVIVTNVLPGTGAEAGGVQVDDLIVGFDGATIRSMGDLAAAVRLHAPNETVTVDVIRGGQPLQLTVTLGTLPS